MLHFFTTRARATLQGLPPMPDAAVFDTKDELEVLETAAAEWTARVMEGLPAGSTSWRSTAVGIDPARWGDAEGVRQLGLLPAVELALLQSYDGSADERVRKFGQWLRGSPRCAIRLPSVDWASLSFGQHLRQLEVEGFTVFPSILPAEMVNRLKASIVEAAGDVGVDYSKFQRIKNDVEFASPEITELIGHPPTVTFLRRLFGSTPVMMKANYGRSEPGHPGIPLHSDAQPWGSKIFGFEHSCPRLVRILYYLDELTPHVSPL